MKGLSSTPRWDWSVACITLCGIHQAPLLDECPACGETDPLNFSGVDLQPDVICRSCNEDLACNRPQIELTSETRHAVDATYRASLVGVDPSPEILGKSTAQQFCAFIEDMHRVLRPSLNLLANCSKLVPVSFSRHDILHIIALLIRNAAPTSDLRIRTQARSTKRYLMDRPVSGDPRTFRRSHARGLELPMARRAPSTFCLSYASPDTKAFAILTLGPGS